MLLAGNPLIKIEAVQVVFCSHGQTGLRFCQMESKTQASIFFITESLLLFAQISFI